MEKYGTLRHATDDNMAHARCMLCTKDYKRTLSTSNNFLFSTSQKGMRKPKGISWLTLQLSAN